jgi:hypothetical protein
MRDDFDLWMDETSRELWYPEYFMGGEQGVLNYIAILCWRPRCHIAFGAWRSRET